MSSLNTCIYYSIKTDTNLRSIFLVTLPIKLTQRADVIALQQIRERNYTFLFQPPSNGSDACREGTGQLQGVYVRVSRVYIPGFYWFHSRDWKPNRTELRRYYVNCLRWEMRIHSPLLMITRPSFTGSDGLLSGSQELLREYDDHQFNRYIFEECCFVFPEWATVKVPKFVVSKGVVKIYLSSRKISVKRKGKYLQ